MAYLLKTLLRLFFVKPHQKNAHKCICLNKIACHLKMTFFPISVYKLTTKTAAVGV
jgi:hypothetical protein